MRYDPWERDRKGGRGKKTKMREAVHHMSGRGRFCRFVTQKSLTFPLGWNHVVKAHKVGTN